MLRRLERAADMLGFFGVPGCLFFLLFLARVPVGLLARIPVGARRAVRRIVRAIGHGRLRTLRLAGERGAGRRLLARGLGARRLGARRLGARRLRARRLRAPGLGARVLVVSRALVVARRTIRSLAALRRRLARRAQRELLLFPDHVRVGAAVDGLRVAAPAAVPPRARVLVIGLVRVR